VMDLDPAIEAAWREVRAMLYISPDYTTLYDEVVEAVRAAYPLIAAAVARVTADAIADKIEAIHHEGMPARNHAMKLAANIARSHGSQTQTTEDGQ
jgi:hypothetical protein